MTSLLEERYRRMLRLLPASYRREWEEDMVATFMEGAYASDPDDPEGVELGRPGRAEIASVAALALRLRLGGADAAPRSFTLGEAVRRVALVGLLAHAVGALVGAALVVWTAYRLPGLPADALPAALTDRWQALWGLTGLLWIPAYLALVHGQHRTARVLALVALAPVLIGTVVDVSADGGAFALSRSYWLLFDALPVLALAAFHGGAPPVRSRPWLVALPAGTAVVLAVSLAVWWAGRQEVTADWPGLWAAGVLVATVVHAARRPAAPHWTLALGMLAVAVLGLRVVTLVDHLTFAVATADRPVLLTVNVAQAAAMLVVAVALLAVSRRAMRRLAPV
ncbi:hypothetical protein AB0M79_13405 [Polymorphospora sp. NPDC051019]|uniref:hypothetical protein n=1 Tax=Polymorphospora sp. NPDC051019 TaxID=3155725 RepID=UPI003421D4AD